MIAASPLPSPAPGAVEPGFDGGRLAALAVVVLTALHAAQLYGTWFYPSAESPLWFNGMVFAQRLLDLPIAASRPWVGAAFAAAGMAIALALWQRRSWTLAAAATLVWAIVSGWDALHRLRQVAFQLGEGWVLGPPHKVGMVAATVALALTVLMLAALVTRARVDGIDVKPPHRAA